MFDHRRCGEKWTNHGAPLGKRRRLAKAHGVVLQRVPEYLQHVAFGPFNAVVKFETLKTGHPVDDIFQTARDGFFKGGVLAGVNREIGKFKNHGNFRWGAAVAGGPSLTADSI